jgi:hypothetical protein
MPRVSTPLLGLLAATVILAVLWVVALKPGSSTSPGGLGAYQGDIAAAHRAAKLEAGITPTTTDPIATTPARPARVKLAPPPREPSTPAARERVVVSALRAHKVLAALFYNPAAADDRAVAQELRTLSLRSSRLVTIAVPVSELARYAVITNTIPITVSPTLVIIGGKDDVTSIVGYTTTFEMRQRIVDALGGGD